MKIPSTFISKAGKALFVLGLIWTTFFEAEVGPYARSMEIHHMENFRQDSGYTRQDLNQVVEFAQNGLFGVVLMAIGGFMLWKPGNWDSTA